MYAEDIPTTPREVLKKNPVETMYREETEDIKVWACLKKRGVLFFLLLAVVLTPFQFNQKVLKEQVECIALPV